MRCFCSVLPETDCVCITRELPDKDVSAVCLLFGYGSMPPDEAAFEDGISLTTTGVAGMLSDTINQYMHSSSCMNLDDLVTCLESTLKAANRKVYRVSQQLGQGIYTGGIVIYSVGMRYAFAVWGGASLLDLRADSIHPLIQGDGNWIYDALGQSEFWKGRFGQGVLPLYGSIIGASISVPPEAQQALFSEQQISEVKSLTEILIDSLPTDGIPPAIIEIRR